MTVWFIEPHDPLIARDGRPFSASPGAQAYSLPFPFPSTTTGGVRTRAGLNPQGIFLKEKINVVKKIRVRGPLLAQLAPNSYHLESWLVPAPQDALLFDNDQKGFICRRLLPLEKPENTYINMAKKKGEDNSEFALVGLLIDPSEPTPDKPSKNVPPFWFWDTFEHWLLVPESLDKAPITVTELGHNGPQREQRIHVSIDNQTLVGKEGALFGTSGLEFTYTGSDSLKRLTAARQLALAIAVDGVEASPMQEGFAGLGGERRMVRWSKSDIELPSCPGVLQESIVQSKACRVLLLTPAHFTLGYQPSWLLKPRDGVVPRLVAIAATHRPQVVSGWDFEKSAPKPSRRLAAQGTVFFLSLEGKDDDIKSWIQRIWMECISDEEQDRNDGFGVAVLGVWSGNLERMRV